jgi:hypothetical protein
MNNWVVDQNFRQAAIRNFDASVKKNVLTRYVVVLKGIYSLF